MFTADFALPARNVNGHGVRIAQRDFGCNGGIQQFTLNAVIATIRNARLLANVIRQQMVEIIAAERGITAGCQHFKHAAT
ncbi:NAD-specific glutamate dehydrogenase [Shigella sonnei]|nr:NAD-specific glutamate dehydrogenase [Shigella sonnei]